MTPADEDLPVRGPDGLFDFQRAVLDFERSGSWGPHNRGTKESQIREQLGISASRYAQILNHLLDEQAALAYAPVLVNHLRRVRHQARIARGSLPPDPAPPTDDSAPTLPI
ncbi:DUF3263 domain-containing protein [Kitasatospora viridis]|uniref:Uncharacterized protein DUF3263 n=1 Tax=Kitasatospora viridis TaxID=281105 RepID=A0A561SAA0_9ACTN|nr:DUF3263 domain-containing protein [Kitasatospora viridis]TWF71734.1 uncharacterized protein DUF3263 [Kitasatospora viridis]